MRYLTNASTAIAALTLTMSSFVYAADTAEIKITGRLTPASCTPTIANNGVIALGNISKPSLNETQDTLLSQQQIGFTITCDAAAKIAVGLKDMRASSVSPNAPQSSYGLGFQGNSTPIGYANYTLMTNTLKGDGASVAPIQSNDLTAWQASSGAPAFDPVATTKFGFATTGTATPAAFTTYAGRISLDAGITKAEDLDFTSSFNLDGLAIFEVFYL